ncbi:hypothetical protein N181_19635 [Sinorhizobium fredii USDA 205]|uniref:Uncharacterized protein n=1 Tax=Rhizobium fredii TaxID=380 RepID=A0A844ACY4_RHIFR|nr:hypothetical protein [Sinorhizobium fredii]KSV87141.1 hypothetical protein N181_19635 [Sinorhizobium fredii USDA 205]MQX10181.1 hypothetical protein [Sinorhizobium fredii]GEC32166.1 hypothetical protein EFR01_23370 [Sinorhizobium fredii]GLS07386.1 hypothetical protein GCM10007864_10130 [Sinorhizobium fredii]
MYIAYFEYEDTTYFFGHLSGTAVTRFTHDVEEARLELEALAERRNRPLEGRAAARAPFVQGFVQRKIDIADDGSLRSFNYFPETLIVHVRRPVQTAENELYFVFMLRNRTLDVPVPTLKDALFVAENVHKLATIPAHVFQDD